MQHACHNPPGRRALLRKVHGGDSETHQETSPGGSRAYDNADMNDKAATLDSIARVDLSGAELTPSPRKF
jgi:hypothetical protein